LFAGIGVFSSAGRVRLGPKRAQGLFGVSSWVAGGAQRA